MLKLDTNALSGILSDKNIDDLVKKNSGSITLEEGIKRAKTIGDEFRDILRQEITASAGSDFRHGDLGETAISSLTDIYVTTPVKSSIAPNTYEVNIGFNGDMHRESLMVGYEGINDISALLNNGYRVKNGTRIRGKWYNDYIWSLPERLGSNFMQRAVSSFKTKYGSSSGVEVILNEKYK